MSSLTEGAPDTPTSQESDQHTAQQPRAVLFVDGDLPESVEILDIDIDFELVDVAPVTLGAVVARRC